MYVPIYACVYAYIPQYKGYACRCEGPDIVSLVRSRSRDKRANKIRR